MDELLLQNMDQIFGRTPVDIKNFGACECPNTEFYIDDFKGFMTCQTCGIEKRMPREVVRVRRGLYRSVHYLHSLLKAYSLTNKKIPQPVIQRIRKLWREAGCPPPTKTVLQLVMRTRTSAEFRPYLRYWRTIQHKLTGHQPQPLSRAIRARIHAMFLMFHRAFVETGCYEERKSMINFPFHTRRILELLNLDHLKEHWPGLTGTDKFATHYAFFARMTRFLKLPLIKCTF